MISREELAELKNIRKTGLFYEEKEYLQYIFLYEISSWAEHFTFKGGTCLRICYGSQRASEDLDFNTDFPPAKLREMISTSLQGFTLLNIPHTTSMKKEREGNLRFEIRFQGPLFQGHPESTNTLKIDFNKRKVYCPVAKVVSKLFSDVPPFTIMIMEKQEILAEKIRALFMRAESRDAYDVWWLLNQGVILNKKLLQLKLDEEKKQFRSLKLPSVEEYHRDLEPILKVIPPHEQVEKEVMKVVGALN